MLVDGRPACASCSRRCSTTRHVRFVDFLKATVLLSAGAATALAVVTVLAAGTQDSDRTLVLDRGRLVGRSPR